MLKINKLFSHTKGLACRTIQQQCFSVFHLSDKKFDPAIYDVLIKDIDSHDLHY
jgi:hypothetical protein